MSGIRKLVTNGLQILSSAVKKSKGDIQIVTKPIEISTTKLTDALDCLASDGRTQIVQHQKLLSPDIQYLRQLTNKFSQSDLQIAQTKEAIIEHLKKISANLEEMSVSAPSDKVDDIFAKKAVIDYLLEHISYSRNFSEQVGFRFGLPTKMISGDLTGFQEEFEKSVSSFKKEGILSISDYDPKKHQFDAEDIMEKYSKITHDAKQREYDKLFDPIERLRTNWCSDPHLNHNANFYRIISPEELKSLAQTKKTGVFINSNGHFTNGNYSCITTNPNYSEQAFAANGLPIRLKFKTKDDNGFYNMDLLDRISGLKQERSIYRVSGYNYDDIDWNNVCINQGDGWVQLSKDCIEEIMSELSK